MSFGDTAAVSTLLPLLVFIIVLKIINSGLIDQFFCDGCSVKATISRQLLKSHVLTQSQSSVIRQLCGVHIQTS